MVLFVIMSVSFGKLMVVIGTVVLTKLLLHFRTVESRPDFALPEVVAQVVRFLLE